MSEGNRELGSALSKTEGHLITICLIKTLKSVIRKIGLNMFCNITVGKYFIIK